MTIIERALTLIPQEAVIGLGSGRASQAFVRALGAQVTSGTLRVRGVPTSEDTAALAREVGIPLIELSEAGVLDLTVDGADEVDPQLNLIKGYGRALVREKIVAASSRQMVILVGQEKMVPQLGSRGKLPVEIVPFALPLCQRRLAELGCLPTLWVKDDRPQTTDNGNFILDCEVQPISNPVQLESDILAVPGVVGTGLFLGMASVVLVGEDKTLRLTEERKRSAEGNRHLRG